VCGNRSGQADVQTNWVKLDEFGVPAADGGGVGEGGAGGASGQRFPRGDTISWSQANYYGDPLSLDPYGYAYDLALQLAWTRRSTMGSIPTRARWDILRLTVWIV